MKTFIKLTNVDEQDIFVNVAHIQTIQKDGDDTALQFEDGTVFVKETPERIIHAIQSANTDK